MFTLGENTRLGIELAQAERKLEALAYLRRAVTSESVNAEVWLWLAHVTPDLEEYRHCVGQALRLDPHHVTARRMQQDLDYQRFGPPPPSAASLAQRREQHQRRLRRWRITLVLLNALVLIVACAGLYVALWPRLQNEGWRNFLPLFAPPEKTIRFSVGAEAEALNFRVTLPETWMLADTGIMAWRQERARLKDEFPEASPFWDSLEADLSTLERDPATGEYNAPVVIVETDSSRIGADPRHVPRLELVSIQRLDSSCAGLEALAERERTASDDNLIEAEVRRRPALDDCLYIVQARTSDPQDETPLRVARLIHPVEADLVASWLVTLPESQARDYQSAIDSLADSLQFIATP
jgi:hypothetical protein